MVEKALLVGSAGLVSGICARSLFVYNWQSIAFVALLSLLGAGAYVLYRSRGYVYVSLFLLMFVLGSVRVLVVPQELPERYAQLIGTAVTLEGVVVADPDIRESAQRVRVEVREGEETVRILAVLPLYPSVEYGDALTVEGKLTLPEAFATDGGREFDYPHFLAKDGVLAVMNRASSTVRDTGKTPYTNAIRLLYFARHTFERGVSRALPEPASALAVGILTGGKQGLGKLLLDAFTISGLLPLVVLSGYNVMIVAEAVLRGLRFAPKRFALLLAGVTIFFFVLASGAGASSVRAGIMAGVGLFARATGRTYAALRALAFVFVCMLIFNPLLLFYDPGFQFSFVATLGLVVGAPIISKRLTWVKSTSIRELLAATLSAQIFVLPLLLYQTGNLSLVAVPANILALPAVPFAMLFSFVAGIAGLVAPAIAVYVGLPAYALLSFIIGVATMSAALPFASLVVPAFSFGFVLLLYALIAFAMFNMKKAKVARPYARDEMLTLTHKTKKY
jgi:competence protein ComEC